MSDDRTDQTTEPEPPAPKPRRRRAAPSRTVAQPPVPEIAGLPRIPQGRPPGSTASPERQAARLAVLVDSATRVRALRARLGWSQQRFVDALRARGLRRVSKALVSLWEQGPYARTNPTTPSAEAWRALEQLEREADGAAEQLGQELRQAGEVGRRVWADASGEADGAGTGSAMPPGELSAEQIAVSRAAMLACKRPES